MGNVNCCKGPEKEPVKDELTNDANLYDKEGYPHDSVVNRENQVEEQNLPKNEEIEVEENDVKPQDENNVDNNQNEENGEEEANEENPEQNQQIEDEHKEPEEQEIDREEGEGEHVEDGVKEQIEDKVIDKQAEQQLEKEELKKEDQVQEQAQVREEQPPHINEGGMEEVEDDNKQELSEQEKAQREIIEQQIAQDRQNRELDIERDYKDIIGETVGQTTYINEPTTEENQNYEILNNVEPVTMKDADEVNNYFQNLGTNVTSYTNNDNININSINSNFINENQIDLNNLKLESNVISGNEEDLKYFNQNASTPNNNIDLASLGLATSTQVQGAATEEEINKYFQNNEFTSFGNNYSEYNINNSNNIQYNIPNTSSNIVFGDSQGTTEFKEYATSQVQKNTATMSYVTPPTVTTSYNYNYDNPIQYNY